MAAHTFLSHLTTRNMRRMFEIKSERIFISRTEIIKKSFRSIGRTDRAYMWNEVYCYVWLSNWNWFTAVWSKELCKLCHSDVKSYGMVKTLRVAWRGKNEFWRSVCVRTACRISLTLSDLLHSLSVELLNWNWIDDKLRLSEMTRNLLCLNQLN